MAYEVPGTAQAGLKLDYRFSRAEVARLLEVRPQDVTPPRTLSYTKNVFLPLTTACRYTCAYCVYYDVPGRARLMDEAEVRDVLERGARAGCREALFTFGEKPDARYREVHDKLARWGYRDLHAYHLAACRWALETGLLPHSNPGDMTPEELAALKEVNASLGMMLETTAEVPAHAGRRRKTPARRLQTLEWAGQLKIPFTTGLLIGIGETWEDRAVSLLALRRLQEAYGHLQEVIIQNVVPNRRWRRPGPSVATLRRVVAMARVALPAEVEIQVPPNLAPVEALLDCGVGDLGGVSPVTRDHVNPDYPWPQVRALQALAARHGRTLRERLPVYDRFLREEGWLSPRLRAALAARKVATAGAGAREGVRENPVSEQRGGTLG